MQSQEVILEESATSTQPGSVIVSTVPSNGVSKKIAEFPLEGTNLLLQVRLKLIFRFIR